MEEVWKDIFKFEDYYQVSNLGRVRSLTRYVNNAGKRTLLKGRILSCTLNTSGYPHINLRKNGRRQAYRVHRLVAQHFIDNPNNYGLVNHIDSNKTNNKVENLEWCTENDNRNHARKIFNDTVYGEDCGLSVLTEDQVREIRANGKMGLSNAKIGLKYNVSHETIRNVLNGRSWRHILPKQCLTDEVN